MSQVRKQFRYIIYRGRSGQLLRPSCYYSNRSYVPSHFYRIDPEWTAEGQRNSIFSLASCTYCYILIGIIICWISKIILIFGCQHDPHPPRDLCNCIPYYIILIVISRWNSSFIVEYGFASRYFPNLVCAVGQQLRAHYSQSQRNVSNQSPPLKKIKSLLQIAPFALMLWRPNSPHAGLRQCW